MSDDAKGDSLSRISEQPVNYRNRPGAQHNRLGVIGGSFDPIHTGHLLLAEIAREKLGLDRVLFIPAAISPLKLDSEPRATAKQRVEMLRLAINGNEFFDVDEREIKRGGASFTVDTLREIDEENPDTELFFLMGADSLASFERWKSPKEICELAYVIVLARGGHAKPDAEELGKFLPKPESAAQQILEMPEIEISSSDLRGRMGANQSVRYQIPPAVGAYIAAESLYAKKV
ncbi:MAG: nicotinate-nucleotide adenylyltransferase [Pirellulaceae bacterium]